MKKQYFFVLTFLMLTQLIYAQDVRGVVNDYLNDITSASKLKTTDVSGFQITDVVPSINPQIKHVYVQQTYQGIPIENGRFKLTLKNGQISYAINNFIGNIAEQASKLQGSLTPEDAVMRLVSAKGLDRPQLRATSKTAFAATYSDTRVSSEPIKAEKVYVAENNILKLAWKVNYYELDGSHWWDALIDASSGQIIKTNDWVVTCSFEAPDGTHNHTHDAGNGNKTPTGPMTEEAFLNTSAAVVGGGSYNVYPLGIESPSHGSRSIVTDPAVASASPFGWHDTNGASGAEFTTTRGNNVWAQDDTNGNNGTGVAPNGGSSLNFDFPLNLNNAPSTFLPAATTNLFYWNNIMHDVWYQYGFTEAAGNFQENNYGKGGAGSDSVNADAQDGSGTNNANFATPPDGSNPRMQMFLFTGPTRDGDLDNVIIAHEYGHGISTRLVGGPGTNALGGSEQMGEGWSDWFGLVMTIRPGDTRATARGVGTYAIGQPTTGAGIRPTRYSTDTAVNGTTYGNIGSLSIPHGVGYGFATILWDMTWDLIDIEGYDADQYNGTGGNNIAMSLVIEGLKNTANNPGYVSGRDGILQADQDLYGGQYNCLIWDAFAARGVGVDAVENNNGGTNTNTDQTISFTSGCSGPPPPASCDSEVSSFPYNEGFENTLGAWVQASGDDFDWTVQTGGTPSSSTGPAGAFEGTHYVYMEASDPNFGNKTTILNSPCFDLPTATSEVSFRYQMTGNSVGSIRLELRQDGQDTWTEIWSQSGDQGANWLESLVSLASYAGDKVQLRFRGTTSTSWQGDIAIDAFEITVDTTDTQAPTTPASLTAGGATDTTIDLSWNAATDNVGVTAYEVYQGATLLGEVAGTTAEVTGLTANTAYSFRVRAKDAAGNVSGYSNTASATTTGGTTGGSGCAGGIASFPYTESFEANLGLWSQGGGDDINWTRDASGTPSSGTGPSTGSAGSFYMFVEASGNGTGYPNKRAILNSPCFDLSGETDAEFTFNYHANGTGTMGSIALEASDDNGATWTSVWSQTAHQGNSWQTQTVSLAAYVGGSVQLRFNRVTGNTWQSDVAIDNTRLVAGASQNPPSGYCASNGNSTADEYIQRVEIGSINNATGASAGGYGDFTNLSTSLGASNSITITPRWTGTVYSEGYAVFVDWNRDGDFTDAGETVYTRAASTATSITGTFNTPSGASQGPTRMRVSMKYNGVPTACESFQYGEVEDYIVNIGNSAAAFNGFAGAQNSIADAAFEFSIYPNPVTRGILNVDVLGATAERYTIYNMLGQTVRSGEFTSTLDVSNLQTGVYMIEVQVGDATLNKRFIKK